MSPVATELPADLSSRELEAVYTRHVTEVGEVRPVSAAEDILSTGGHLLVAKKWPINRRVYDKLTRHKLQRPLDRSLAIDEAVGHHDLLITGRRLSENEPFLELLMDALPLPQAPLDALASVTLLGPLAVKLTVLKERMPLQFEHAVRVAMVARALAELAGYQNSDLYRDVTTAGLFHDLGSLHIEPSIFQGQRALEPGEERQLRAHPVIAALLLEEFPEYHAPIRVAVMEHHERLDGTGYPYGLTADELGAPGRILAVAEMAVAVIEHGGGHNLAAILRGQPEKLDPATVKALLRVLKQCPQMALGGDGDARSADAELDELKGLLVLIEQGVLAAEGRDDLVGTLVAERLETLVRSLDRAGLRLGSREEWREAMNEDAMVRLELAALTREARYRLREIIVELRYRKRDPGAVESGPLGEWLAAVQAL